MTSDELNEKINLLCDTSEWAIEGGKCIPYIGWYWRWVNFDADSYAFGVIPGRFIGFMENNKWSHGYTRKTTPEEWSNIKKLLVNFVENPGKETAKSVWDAVQAIEVV